MSEALDLADMQGLIVRGYGRLPFASILLAAVTDPEAARRMLGRWTATVTDARTAPEQQAMNLLFTADGLRALTGRAELPSGFAEPFRTGMVTPYRSRLLGDEGVNDPGKWLWGGSNTPPVHIAVLLYAREADQLETLVRDVVDDAEHSGLTLQRRLRTDQLTDREHFGFRDGISQPLLEGLRRRAETGGFVREGDFVRDGEFVLGYVNEYGQRTERPLLPDSSDPDRILPTGLDGSPAADLGRNGSYVVLRQLSQDVEGFWQYVDRAAGPQPGARERLAAAIVGRWPGGAPLVLSPDHDDPAKAVANDFGYHDSDAQGLACPIGAHIRRANPRDSLPPRPGTDASLAVNHRHRLLRRGRNYTDGEERGLYFVCLNTNIARQYEFVQHTWINDPTFNLLDDAEDPLVGPRPGNSTTFTVQARPARRRYRDVPRFVEVRGGAYFFLPGIRALRYLASSAVLWD